MDSGTRIAAAPKQTRGTAVTMPIDASSAACPVPSLANVDPPCALSHARYPSAGRNCTAVSAASDSTPPRLTFFLTSPYVAKENARTSEIHGSRPYPTVRTTTAANPTPTATHCTGRIRSFSSRTPIAMVTSGLMKYPRDASTTCPALTDQMYTPQLTVITDAATTTSASRFGCRSSSFAHAQRRTTSSAPATTASDHTIRWARISTDPAGFSSGQYSGTSPHIP